jgi:hypothetical protein
VEFKSKALPEIRDVNETLHDETETLVPRDETRPRRSKKRLETETFETQTIHPCLRCRPTCAGMMLSASFFAVIYCSR